MIRKILKADRYPVILCLLMTGMWLMIDMATGKSFFGPTPYNTYTLQALSWLEGHTWVENDPILELAIFGGKYYVSFPPLPSIVLLPFAALLGVNTPDNFLVKAEACAAVLFLYHSMKKVSASSGEAAGWSFLAVFASCFLPLTLEGAVWYHAQTLALMLVTGALYMLTEDRMGPALLMYALSVAARPFDALYFFPIMGTWAFLYKGSGITVKDTVKKLAPGFALGLTVALAIGIYNFCRFSDPFEFGHNYLPEFSFQGGTQFSLSHVPVNFRTFVLSLPFETGPEGLELKIFGFSFLIACPVLTLMILWFVVDIFKRRADLPRVLTFCIFAVHLLLLLTHRTFGGYQFGARYCTDLMPYAFLYRLLRKEREKTPAWEWVFLGIGLAFCVYGSIRITL